MAVCHRVSADEPGLSGADTEQGVLGEQLAGSSHRTWDVGSGADTPGLGQVS
jgi:hypothetical protein